MTPFYFLVSSFPFALYLLATSCLHCGARPRLVTGRRDFFALAFATAGLVFIGPGQLAPTLSSLTLWGKYVWLWFALLYLLFAQLVALKLSPKLVVYNATYEELRRIVTTVALRLDETACWSGCAMNAPGCGFQFYLDDNPKARVITLTAIGRDFSLDAWKSFAAALSNEFKSVEREGRPRGRGVFYALLTFGLTLLVADAICFVKYFDAIRDAASFFLSV